MEIYWFMLLTAVVVTTLTVPLLIDGLKFVVPHWRLSRITGRASHSILFIIFGGLVIIINRYHYVIYMPLLLENKSHFQRWAHLIFSIWLWINILGNYYYTVTMHPGKDATYMSRKVIFEKKKLAANELDASSQKEHVVGKAISVSVDIDNISQQERPVISSIPKSCAICQKKVKARPQNGLEWEPSKSRFCSICQCAILYWDHHCPFTGNCIGLCNYSNFFIGLCYGLIGGFYAMIISWYYFYNCNILPVVSKYPYGHDLNGQCEEIGENSYIFMPTLLLFWLTLFIVILHIVFLLADVSTYDVLSKWDVYPVSLFIMQRIRGKKFLDSGSRLQILLIQRKKALLSMFVPIRNSVICTEFE